MNDLNPADPVRNVDNRESLASYGVRVIFNRVYVTASRFYQCKKMVMRVTHLQQRFETAVGAALSSLGETHHHYRYSSLWYIPHRHSKKAWYISLQNQTLDLLLPTKNHWIPLPTKSTDRTTATALDRLKPFLLPAKVYSRRKGTDTQNSVRFALSTTGNNKFQIIPSAFQAM